MVQYMITAAPGSDSLVPMAFLSTGKALGKKLDKQSLSPRRLDQFIMTRNRIIKSFIYLQPVLQP